MLKLNPKQTNRTPAGYWSEMFSINSSRFLVPLLSMKYIIESHSLAERSLLYAYTMELLLNDHIENRTTSKIRPFHWLLETQDEEIPRAHQALHQDTIQEDSGGGG